MTPRGFEPLLPPWKGGVLTTWPWSRTTYYNTMYLHLSTNIYLYFLVCLIFIANIHCLINSPSRARTYNPTVNSRVLYHWAIEDYIIFLNKYIDKILHMKMISSISVKTYLGQALDLLVTVSYMCYHTSTSVLSTLWSSRGLTCLLQWDILSWGRLHA